MEVINGKAVIDVGAIRQIRYLASIGVEFRYLSDDQIVMVTGLTPKAILTNEAKPLITC